MKTNDEKVKNNLCFSFFSFDHGLQVYEHVHCIRVKCKHYNLLIMEDHTPCIGEIDGSISILKDDEEIRMDHMEGFYMLKKNEFHFLEKGKFKIDLTSNDHGEEKDAELY